MNRKIKFRAYHKAEKKMYRVLSLVLGQREQDVTLVRHEGPYVTCPLGEVELLQFTGLTDKHGKDIYEGDILKADWQDVRYPVHTIGPVTWDEKNARWDVGEGGCPQVDAQYHFEVIGNIYEQPELLK